MTSPQQTVTPPASAPARSEPMVDAPAWIRLARPIGDRLAPHHLALGAVLALSAVLNVYRLSQNGYANIFYSAGVKSMLRSLHNFAFVSFDPGGLIMVDKPPLGLWLQAASAKLFGFAPLSLLLPEAIVGVVAVALLYRLMTRRFGPLAALAGALALAVFPSFVAVSRDNAVDPLLILLMILACDAALRATETGRWRTLLWCGALVGLAFNTKTLAAYLVVPGIALAYLVCAPGSIPRRAAQLLAAGLVMVLVSFSWIAFVDLTPASKRPYVGGSTNNSELGLTFEYNGFGRVGGQVGGPGRIPAGAGALVHAAPRPVPKRRTSHTTRTRPVAPRALSSVLPDGRARLPVAFGGPAGPLRLFAWAMGDQGGWILPFAFLGLLAVAMLALTDRWRREGTRWSGALPPQTGALPPQTGAPPPQAAAPRPLDDLRSDTVRPRRSDPRLAGMLVLGGWFLVEAVVLSLSKGIVHPYYLSALAPGAAAMAGAGAGAFAELARRRPWDWRIALAPCAVVATVAVQLVLLRREHYMHWFIPVLVSGAAIGVAVLLSSPRLAHGAIAATFCLLLVAPTAYASTTWLAPVAGTFPAAGPTQASGAGGVGLNATDVRRDRALIRYVNAHGPGSRWAVLTNASETAAPFILLGLDAGALTGYSGIDPALDGPELAQLVARGQARYVLLGGEFSGRGGNRATRAVLGACRQVPTSAWLDARLSPQGLVLFDCAGRERELSSA